MGPGPQAHISRHVHPSGNGETVVIVRGVTEAKQLLADLHIKSVKLDRRGGGTRITKVQRKSFAGTGAEMQYAIIVACDELLKQGQGISSKEYLATAESAPTQDQAAPISHHANAGRLTASLVQPSSVQASQDFKIENENEHLGVILVIMYITYNFYIKVCNFLSAFSTYCSFFGGIDRPTFST